MQLDRTNPMYLGMGAAFEMQIVDDIDVSWLGADPGGLCREP
jgi:hypothetical protein